MLGFQVATLLGKQSGLLTRTLDFTQGQLPSGVAFTRASSGDRYNALGNWGAMGTNVPCFDHEPVTLVSRGLALRPRATNTARWSNRMDNAVWTKTSCTISGTPVTGTDGTSSAYRLVEGTGSITPSIVQTCTVGSATKRCTVVAEVKPNGRTNVQFWVWNTIPGGSGTQVAQAYSLVGAGSLGADYIVSDTKLAKASASIKLLSNGYYRITLTYDKSDETTNRPALVVTNSTSLPAPNYTGDGSSGIYVQHFGLYVGDPSGTIVTTTASASRENEDLTLSSITPGVWDVTTTDDFGSYSERYAVNSDFKFRPRLGSRHVKRITAVRVGELPTYEAETWSYNTSLVSTWGRYLSSIYLERVNAFVLGAKAIPYNGSTLLDWVGVLPMQNFLNRADDYDRANLVGLGGKFSTWTLSPSSGFNSDSGEWTWTPRGFRVKVKAGYITGLFSTVAFGAGSQRAFIQCIDLEASATNNSRHHAQYSNAGATAVGTTVNANIAYVLDGVTTGAGSGGDLNVRSYIGMAAGAGDNTVNRYTKKSGDFASGTRNFAAGSLTGAVYRASFGPATDWCNYPIFASIEGPRSREIMDQLTNLFESTLLNEGVGAVPVLLSDGQSNASGELLSRVTTTMATVVPSLRVGPNLLTGGVSLRQWVSGTTSLAMNSTALVAGATGIQKLDQIAAFLNTLPAPPNPAYMYFFQGESDTDSLSDAQWWDERAAFYFSTIRTQFNIPGMVVFIAKVHFSISSNSWGTPSTGFWTQARRDQTEILRRSQQSMDLLDNKLFVLETYGYERAMDDPTDGMYNANDNVHWNYDMMQKMADAMARLVPMATLLGTKTAACRRICATAIAAGDTLTSSQVTQWEQFVTDTAAWTSRCVRLINPLFSSARAKTMDLITGDVVTNPPTVKITYYVKDTLSGPDAASIQGCLFAVTGSSNNEAKQHSLLVSGATTTAANGTYFLKSSHTTTTGSVAYVGTVWVKNGDNDIVISGPDCTRAGVQQTSWRIEQHGVGVLYQHASTFGSVRPPAWTLWTVGAAGSGTVPTVVENL